MLVNQFQNRRHVSNQLISLASRENLIEPLSPILRFVVFPIN